MAYPRAGKTDEVTQLRDEITREVNVDSEHLARQIFPRKGQQPDIQRVPNSTVEARYRAAYQNQDRKWLIAEAQRDPEQFIEVARRIGVMLPEEIPPMPPAPAAPLPTPPPVPVAPPSPPAPVVTPASPALPPTSPEPVIPPMPGLL